MLGFVLGAIFGGAIGVTAMALVSYSNSEEGDNK